MSDQNPPHEPSDEPTGPTSDPFDLSSPVDPPTPIGGPIGGPPDDAPPPPGAEPPGLEPPAGPAFGAPTGGQYFYLDASGTQQGPVSAEQIRAMISTGAVTRDRYVWQDGMPDWVPARDVPELVSGVAPPVNPVSVVHNPGVRDPWGGPAMPPSTSTASGLNKLFIGYVVTIGLSIAGMVLGGLVMIIAAIAADGDFDYGPPPAFFIGMIVLGLAGLLYLVPTVLHHILVYKYWRLIQDGHAETTPGKATGFLFIPLFQYYWLFVAYWGLAKDLNAYADRHGVTMRRPSPGLALGAIITLLVLLFLSACLYFLPLVFAVIPWAIMVYQLHRASVDVARHLEQSSPADPTEQGWA